MDLSPFDALKPLAGRALEIALNQALALDPDTSAALLPLEGRRIQLKVDVPPLAMDIMVGGGRLQVGPASEVLEADLAVRSTLGGLLGQLPFFRRDHATAVGKVKVSGDADLARRLQTLATRFDPDWSLPFTRVFGDVIGVQVANAVRGGLQQARTAAGNWRKAPPSTSPRNRATSSAARNSTPSMTTSMRSATMSNAWRFG